MTASLHSRLRDKSSIPIPSQDSLEPPNEKDLLSIHFEEEKSSRIKSGVSMTLTESKTIGSRIKSGVSMTFTESKTIGSRIKYGFSISICGFEND